LIVSSMRYRINNLAIAFTDTTSRIRDHDRQGLAIQPHLPGVIRGQVRPLVTRHVLLNQPYGPYETCSVPSE
jgi:hypothetical protein